MATRRRAGGGGQDAGRSKSGSQARRRHARATQMHPPCHGLPAGMATKSGSCGRCVGRTRGETARQSTAGMWLHNHGIATTRAT
eukprot:6303792-Prymnesium_polylepis.1